MGFVKVHQFYCDESGKYHKDPLTAFCGVMADESRIDSFDKDWRAILLSYDLDYLHMKLISRTEEDGGAHFPKGQPISEKIELLKPFADCINKHLQLGLIQCWDVKGYALIPWEAKRLLGGSHDPYLMSFVNGLLELLKHIPEDDRISIICDDDVLSAWDAYLHYRESGKSEGKIRKAMIAISFANDKYFPALQAADMLAFLTRYEGEERFYGRSNSWSALYEHLVSKSSREHRGLMRWFESYQDEASMVDLANSMQELVEKVGNDKKSQKQKRKRK